MALRDDVDSKKASKLAQMRDAQDEAQSWIEAVTGQTFDGDFADFLKDGKALCALVNAVEPGTIKKVSDSKLAFKQMENISNFTRAAKKLGMHEHDCFDTEDLYNAKDIAKVIQAIHSFGGIVQKRGTYSGPTLGRKVADKNVREFTPEQLAKSAALAQSQLTAGSSATMERTETTKQGITFGNAMVGSGSGEATAISAGSSGTMERAEAPKHGITFGNHHAGAGDAHGTAVSTAVLTGSAGGAPTPPRPKKKGGGDGAAVEDSNMALVGSDADKDARKKAALLEPAWEGCGAKVGLEIWRIEKFQVVPWPKEEYGSFYDGDSYIVLSTTLDPESAKLGGEKLLWDIHFWLGENTSLDEQGTAAYKTVELDDLMGGAPVQHRECMNYESEAFTALFEPYSGVRYMEGGIDSGFNKVEADAYIAKLFHVRKTKKHGMKVVQVPCALASLNHGDCFILDAGALIYVWAGDECSAFEKRAANAEAENIENQRNGHATATFEITDQFWALLGGGPDGVAPASAATDDIGPGDVGEGVMYKLSDEGGELMCNEVMRGDLKLEHLDTNEVMLVDTASGELFVWVGKGASDKESRNALKTATALLESIGKPKHTPIHLYKEGAKITNPIWVEVFS